MLYTHVYTSESTEWLDEPRLRAMAAEFSARNALHGITGMMFLVGRHFVQILEGERETVWRLLHNIRADARSRGFITLYHGALLKRRFPRWNMRAMRLDDEVRLSAPGVKALRDHLHHLMAADGDRQATERLLHELPRLLPLAFYAARERRAKALLASPPAA